MKFRLLVSTVLLFFVVGSYAQELSKVEKKRLKKQLRSYLKTPKKFKDLKESLIDFKKIFPIENIHLIDKGSDYQPLLDYYQALEEEGMKIIYSDPMTGGPDGPGGLNDLHQVIDKYIC